LSSWSTYAAFSGFSTLEQPDLEDPLVRSGRLIDRRVLGKLVIRP
jgi:hypothetical protein